MYDDRRDVSPSLTNLRKLGQLNITSAQHLLETTRMSIGNCNYRPLPATYNKLRLVHDGRSRELGYGNMQVDFKGLNMLRRIMFFLERERFEVCSDTVVVFKRSFGNSEMNIVRWE